MIGTIYQEVENKTIYRDCLSSKQERCDFLIR